MDAKEKKFTQIDALISHLELSREEVAKYLMGSPVTKPATPNVSEIRPGMIWYEDDTFFYSLISGKKIKAIVELVEEGVVYGDLTVSELFDIPEIYINLGRAKNYIKDFSYPCKKGEEICFYNIRQLQQVQKKYNAVKRAFQYLGKECRQGQYWSCTVPYAHGMTAWTAWTVDFRTGCKVQTGTFFPCAIRPVLALKVE